MAILSAAGLVVEFGGLKAVSDVTFTVADQRITALIGPNGAGKTTVFNVITGFLAPSRGEVIYNGRPILGLPPHAIARLGLVRSFQDPRVFGNMTVLENVVTGVPGLIGENPLRALLGGARVRSEEASLRARAEELLQFVDLWQLRDEPARSLSYGQQRFLSFARLLASAPRLLLLDEPTVGLDEGEIKRFLWLLRQLVTEQGKTVLLVEHNMGVVLEVSDTVILMVEGKVAVTGPPSQIRQDLAFLTHYMGMGVAEGRLASGSTS